MQLLGGGLEGAVALKTLLSNSDSTAMNFRRCKGVIDL